MRLLEEMLRPDVVDYIENQGYDAYPEVSMLTRKIDILGIKTPRDIIAVELKIRDWKKAHYQAYIASLCANRVYVALPSTSIANVDHLAFVQSGIGLLAVNGNVQPIIPARNLKNIHPMLQQRILKSLDIKSRRRSP